MSLVKIVPLDFQTKDGILIPRDPNLHDLTVDYCLRELKNGQDVNLALLNKVYVAVELDGEKTTKVHGVTGVNVRVDIPLFRATCAPATAKLHQRLHAYLADQGYLGQEVFIYLGASDGRCDGYDQEVAAAELTPADRYLVTVKAV
jgi:hypothetical protein